MVLLLKGSRQGRSSRLSNGLTTNLRFVRSVSASSAHAAEGLDQTLSFGRSCAELGAQPASREASSRPRSMGVGWLCPRLACAQERPRPVWQYRAVGLCLRDEGPIVGVWPPGDCLRGGSRHPTTGSAPRRGPGFGFVREPARDPTARLIQLTLPIAMYASGLVFVIVARRFSGGARSLETYLFSTSLGRIKGTGPRPVPPLQPYRPLPCRLFNLQEKGTRVVVRWVERARTEEFILARVAEVRWSLR